MSREQFWSIWSQARWIPSAQARLDRFLGRIILYSVSFNNLHISASTRALLHNISSKFSLQFQARVELAITGLRDITQKELN